MDQIQCPYCKTESAYLAEDFQQDARWKEECESCGKLFMVTGRYTRHFDGEISDCINGGEKHSRKGITVMAGSDEAFRLEMCFDCGTELSRTAY